MKEYSNDDNDDDNGNNINYVNMCIYICKLIWEPMVGFLRTSGYRYDTFLEYYVHNIWGTVSHSFFTMQFIAKIWVPMLYPFLMY